MIRGIEIDGNNVDFKDVVSENRLGAIYPIVVSIAETQRENGMLHVGDLTASPRQYWLFKRYDLYLPYEALVDRWIGSCIHKAIQATGIGIHELQSHAEIAGVQVYGTVDFYDKKAKMIVDYKTCKQYMINWVMNGRKDRKTGELTKGIGEWHPEWVEQLNMYKYLCETNDIPVEDMQIVMIAKDAGSKQAIQAVDVPVIEDIEQLMIDRITLLQSLKDAEDEDLPICKDRWDKDLKCREYCDCRRICSYALSLNSDDDVDF